MAAHLSRLSVAALGALFGGCASTGGLTGWLGNSATLESESLAVEGIDARIEREGSVPNGTVDHFAVLIGANTELRHQGNLSMAYQVLVEQGYRRDQIYILDNGSEPSGSETLFFPMTDRTTRATMHSLFDHLKRVVEPHDTLLIYVTGHGRRVTAEAESNGERQKIGVSTLLLNKAEEMSEFEFSGLLDGIHPAVGIAFFDQCYGAIFSTTAPTCNFVFITTAAEDETSYGVSFPRAFWSAFRERTLPGHEPSIAEAYEFARTTDKGTRMGYNRPNISHGCVNANALTLLGSIRAPRTVLSQNAKPAK
jgi:hypothetical protein